MSKNKPYLWMSDRDTYEELSYDELDNDEGPLITILTPAGVEAVSAGSTLKNWTDKEKSEYIVEGFYMTVTSPEL